VDTDDREDVHIFVSNWEPAPSRLDSNVVVCAIGDVHGQLKHLSHLTEWIRVNVLNDPALLRHIIMLGDYVDRGPSGIATLDFVGRLALSDVKITRLVGNHDIFLDTFLHDECCDFDLIDLWTSVGGRATLAELGISDRDLLRRDMKELREKAVKRITASALACLNDLEVATFVGNYLFVHAGIHPQRIFDRENVEELTWIREPFLSGERWQHGFAVVHGHTPCGPDVKPHRIAVDSGAFSSGVLTCAQLRETSVRFIAATHARDLRALDTLPGRRKLVTEQWIQVQ
jgi:serine/threonine protein phosphatase 1